MLTAAKAREIAKKNSSELELVLNYIEQIAELGYFNGIMWFETEETIKQLKKLGFKIKPLNFWYKNQLMYIIYW